MSDQPTKTVIVHVHDGPKPAKLHPILVLLLFAVVFWGVALSCNGLMWVVEALR